MPEIGFSLQPQYDLPIARVISLLKDAGFSGVSPVWSPECDLASLIACLGDHNMTIHSLHAPRKGVASLWQPDSPESSQAQKNIISCLNCCKDLAIPIMVLHCWHGLHYTFPNSPLDFRFFDNLVGHAEKQGVSIAIENLEGEEYLQALMDRYADSSHVGFCWDSGHDHCYPHKTDFLASYGHRLIMTHLNDNWGLRDPNGVPSGTDDLHFLPYDGNLDWDSAMDRLSKAAGQDILNFEFKVRSKSTNPSDLIYTQMTLEQFIHTAGQRAKKIAKLYDTKTA